MNNDKSHVLTMLYLQNQDLSQYSPTELVQKYDAVYAEIDNYMSDKEAEKLNDCPCQMV